MVTNRAWQKLLLAVFLARDRPTDDLPALAAVAVAVDLVTVNGQQLNGQQPDWQQLNWQRKGQLD